MALRPLVKTTRARRWIRVPLPSSRRSSYNDATVVVFVFVNVRVPGEVVLVVVLRFFPRGRGGSSGAVLVDSRNSEPRPTAVLV